ncbi:MAG: hypothetical protein LAO51_17730 [Acidobacteriia bacterium]|nr:hypothetical protein [Terriglobia bacterium]
MRARFPIVVPLTLAVALALSGAAHCSEPADDDRVGSLEKKLAEMQRVYEARIAALEAEVAALKGSRPPIPVPEAPPVPPAPTPAAPPSQTSNYFNPSVSLIGNYLGVGGKNRTENLPASSLRESEVGLQAIVDPYARADVFLSFGEEGVDVEEGYASFTSLPWGLLAKVGRMRTAFGKINSLHLHVLPWPDEPLPLVNLLGGEEGWIGSGLSVAKLIPLPGDVFSEATLQVFGGDAGIDGQLFKAPERSDLSYNGHYRIFSDLTEATNLDLGLSYGVGPNGSTGSSKTRLGAIDATLRWKPLRTATYRSVTLRGELIRSRKDLLAGAQTADGWFLSGDYQLAKRWFVGARYERADHADDAALHDTGEAATLTFWPSEFSQLRSELRRRMYADGETADEVLLQVQFAIGAHGAHPF